MSKNYSQEVMNHILEEDFPIAIFILKDDSVHIGKLIPGHRSYYKLIPPNIHDYGVGFSRSYIKQIILFNGLIFPKEMNGPHKILNILELNELVNKAGYEFL